MSKERARTGGESQPYRVERKRGSGSSRGWYLKEYDAVRAGTIDGMGRFVNDRAALKADNTQYFPTKNTDKVTGNPLTTLFVGRLSPETTEETLKDAFKEYGEITKVVVARNLVTGHSRCYSFIEFALESSCASAYKGSRTLMIDGQMVAVDYERSRVMINWKPRRLGGGISGYKESGQLRFGARNRPFKFPNESFYKNLKCPIVPNEQLREECWRDHVVPPKNQNESHPRSYPDSADSRSDFQREHDIDRYRRHRNQDERPYSHKTDSHVTSRETSDYKRDSYATNKRTSDYKKESSITGNSNSQHHKASEYEPSSHRNQRNYERIGRAYDLIDDKKTHENSSIQYHTSEGYHQREQENKYSNPPSKRSRYSDQHQSSYSKSSSSSHHHSSRRSHDPEPDRPHRSRHNVSSSKSESTNLHYNTQEFSSSRDRENRYDRYHSRSKH